MTTAPLTRRNARKKPAPRASVTGVLGEVLITIGVIVMLYVVWQMWLGDVILGAQANRDSAQLTDQWASQAQVDPSVGLSDPKSIYNTVTAPPPVMTQPSATEDFAVIRIPRLGANYQFTIAGGTASWESLNLEKVGYYLNTAMPGDKGNFAVAGHRGSHGAPFMNLPQLRTGDAIIVETPAGWYTYRFRDMEYVTPDSTDVLLPTPQNQAAGTNGQYITLTTCSPRYGWSERLIAYGVFESFTPRTTDGKKPASLFLTEAS